MAHPTALDNPSATARFIYASSRQLLLRCSTHLHPCRHTHASMVPFAALGGLLRSHPFDIIHNHGLRHLFKMPALPAYTIRRRFACVMATLMLIATAWCFQTGLPMAGYIVGWSLVAAAFVNVSTGFCVPSFIVRIFFGKVICD